LRFRKAQFIFWCYQGAVDGDYCMTTEQANAQRDRSGPRKDLARPKPMA
jgi:hypothetical protein